MSETGVGSQPDRPGLVDAGRKIETESFRIIESEIGSHGFPPDQWNIVRRVIHTTGDFDYASRMSFHPMAVEAGVKAIRRGAGIFTDTRMMQTGLSPWRLKWFGNPVETPVSNNSAAQELAEREGITRSVSAFRLCGRRFDHAIVAIGNAPTALLELLRLVREEGVRPALVIGTPVGFVQAAESKEALQSLTDQPSIAVLGRKGGSTVGVAILHALLEWARTRNE